MNTTSQKYYSITFKQQFQQNHTWIQIRYADLHMWYNHHITWINTIFSSEAKTWFSLVLQMTCSCISWKYNFRLVSSPMHALLKQRSRLVTVNLTKVKVKADFFAFNSLKPFQENLLLNFFFHSSMSVEVYCGLKILCHNAQKNFPVFLCTHNGYKLTTGNTCLNIKDFITKSD